MHEPTPESVAEFVAQQFGGYDDSVNWQANAEVIDDETVRLSVTACDERDRPQGGARVFYLRIF
jgi:hypothetical protein